MKRLISLLLVFSAIFLCSCKVKNYTPEIPVAFTQNVTVTSGDFLYDCEICKTEKNVRVKILSTSAKGLAMTYDGKNLKFEYNNYSYSIDGSKFEKSNTAIVIYEVFNAIESKQSVSEKKIDGGYEYTGQISLGQFKLIQNDDNSFSSITVKSADYSIKFK